jgi:hypothetical protein
VVLSEKNQLAPSRHVSDCFSTLLGSSLRKHIDETKHNGSANALKRAGALSSEG